MALEHVLAELYRDRARAERVVNDAKMNAGSVAWEPQMIVTWHNILSEAEHQKRMYELLRIALDEYPNYQPLIDAVQAVSPDVLIPTRDVHERIQRVEHKIHEHETAIQWIMRRVNPTLQRRASVVIAVALFLIIWSAWMITPVRDWFLYNTAAAIVISLAFIVAIVAVLWLPGGET